MKSVVFEHGDPHMFYPWLDKLKEPLSPGGLDLRIFESSELLDRKRR